MRKLPKVLLILTLSLTLIWGSTLTAVCATATQTNPKTTGVQIVGNTMMVYGNNHNFYVWGKSVLAQCSGFSDILPNNNTKFVDIQFDGNLYKGLEEVIIVNQNNKNDKVVLEEGSMIITGVKNLEQLSTIRNAVAANPKNLAELKNNMAFNSNALGLDKGFTVTKNGIADENGKAVKVQDIAGAVELVTIKEVNEVIEKEVNNTPEKKPEQKPEQVTKKVIATNSPKPTVKPSPEPCTEHQYSDGEHTYVVCIKCGAKNPYACSGSHDWDTYNGQCRTCGYYCYHKFPEGVAGVNCEICGYNPSVGPVPSAPPVCLHTLGFEDVGSDEFHGCNGCSETFHHNYDAEGHCEDCNHTCNHGSATTGTCSYCGMNLTPPPCYHGSYTFSDETYHKCDNCEAPFAHTWVSGYCSICDSVCPTCNGIGTTDDNGCAVCGKKLCYEDHSELCPSQTCECGEQGTGSHNWSEGKCTKCQRNEYESVNDDFHFCVSSGDNAQHDYEIEVGDSKRCSKCGHVCTHQYGTYESGECKCCWKYIGTCQVDHSQYCTDWECECGEHGTGEHHYDSGVCIYCNANCPVCDNDVDRLGEEEGKVGNRCPFCGFEGL